MVARQYIRHGRDDVVARSHRGVPLFNGFVSSGASFSRRSWEAGTRPSRRLRGGGDFDERPDTGAVPQVLRDELPVPGQPSSAERAGAGKAWKSLADAGAAGHAGALCLLRLVPRSLRIIIGLAGSQQDLASPWRSAAAADVGPDRRRGTGRPRVLSPWWSPSSSRVSSRGRISLRGRRRRTRSVALRLRAGNRSDRYGARTCTVRCPLSSLDRQTPTQSGGNEAAAAEQSRRTPDRILAARA